MELRSGDVGITSIGTGHKVTADDRVELPGVQGTPVHDILRALRVVANANGEQTASGLVRKR